MSLIEFDEYFDPVMKFAFGGTLICKDLDVAKGVSSMSCQSKCLLIIISLVS